MDSKFESLAEHYLSGALAPDEEAELEQFLAADPALRRQFVARLLLEVQLRKAFAGMALPPAAAASSRRTWAPIAGWLAAAVLLLGIGLGAWRVLGTKSILGHEVLAGDVRLEGGAIKLIPEERWFDVAAGAPAVIRLADGSQAEVFPSSRAIVHGKRNDLRLAIELQQGGGKFKVVSSAGQFRVETPVGSVTALGTEFSVKLKQREKPERKRGGTKVKLSLEVAVAEGTVQVEVKGKSYVLTGGASRTFGSEGEGEGEREEDDD